MGKRSPFRAGFLKVELYLGGVWTDVSADLGSDGVTITRGRQDESTQPDPSSCTLTLNNEGGKYSPRNPSSPYYGKLTRNTPIRVTVQPTSPVSAVYNRFQGYVVEWPQRWTKRGTCYTPIVCAGVMRRLGQGAPDLRSPLYRRLVKLPSNCVAYWPCEDGQDAETLRAQRGPFRITWTGEPSLGSFDLIRASAPLPTIGTGAFKARVPGYTAAGTGQVRLMTAIPTSTPNGAVLFRIRATGTLGRLDLKYSTGGNLDLEARDDAGTVLGPGALLSFGFNGNMRVRLSIELTQNGADIDWSIGQLQTGAAAAIYFGGTIPGATLGAIESVAINPDGADLGGMPFGHLTVEKSITSIFAESGPVLVGFAGETAITRVQRLTTEEGLTCLGYTSFTSDPADMPTLGPQGTSDILTLLRDAATADGGMLFEPIGAATIYDLQFRTGESLLAQDPKLTIAYTDNLLRPFEPTDDDQSIRNSVTVTRALGSSSTVTQSSGTLGTAAAGTYSDDVTLNLETDAQCEPQAAWRVHLGTTDEARWPTIGLDLADTSYWTSTLRGDALGVDLGDLIKVTGLPAWLPPMPVEALVQGYTETITPLSWTLVFNTTPAGPYRCAHWGDGKSRYSGAGAKTAEALDTTETGVDITNPSSEVRWTDADGDYDIVIGGERMTVTSVTGTGTTQTLNVVRSVNGVVKSHATNAAVELAEPYFYKISRR